MSTSHILFDDAGRLRSGFRFATFVLVFLAFTFLLGSVFALIARAAPEYLGRLIGSVVIIIAALAAGWICARNFEGLPFRSLGISPSRGWLRNFVVGIGLGAATFGLAVLIAVALGGLRFELNNVDPSSLAAQLAGSFVFLAIAAASEEVLFRGYPFQTLVRANLAWLAILITSMFFAVAHFGNESSTWIAALNTALAGLWFGIAYLKTRDLWFVTGLHLMWNWVQGGIFGVEISGHTDLTASLLREVDSGPAWLTGTTYGVEGGIVTTIALLASTAAIYFMPWLGRNSEGLDQER